MEENLAYSPSESDYLSSSIGSRSGSIDRPGIWVWLADHINKRRSSKKDFNDIGDVAGKSIPTSPEAIGNSLFYLSSSWNPLDMESDETPVKSLETWPEVSSKSEETLEDIDMETEGETTIEYSKTDLNDDDDEKANGKRDRPVESKPRNVPKSLLIPDPETKEQSRERHKMRRNRLFQELLTTEEDYVDHLGSVVNGYISMMKKDKPYSMPEDLRSGKDRIIFGNIEAIYEWHRDYMVKEIRKCVENQSQLGPVFKRWLKKLNMYVAYCQNKNKSEFIVATYVDNYFEDIRLALGHQLRLPDLLIKPIQRIMKYQLILSTLLKYTQDAGLTNELEDLRNALEYMQIVPKRTNDMMALTRLMGYEGSIMTQGKLILQGVLLVGRDASGSLSPSFYHHSPSFVSSKPLKKRYIFLFEKIMIVCKAPNKHHHFIEYIYKFHVNTNKISQCESRDNQSNEFKFAIRLEYSDKPDEMIIMKARSLTEKDQWMNAIQKILNVQMFFIRALTSPIIHQKSLENGFPFHEELSKPL